MNLALVAQLCLKLKQPNCLSLSNNHQDLNDVSYEASPVLPMNLDQDHTKVLCQQHPIRSNHYWKYNLISTQASHGFSKMWDQTYQMNPISISIWCRKAPICTAEFHPIWSTFINQITLKELEAESNHETELFSARIRLLLQFATLHHGEHMKL